MAAHGETALQICCGSCNNVINVPPGLLPQLLQARQFKCPHCKATQALPDTLQPVRQPGGYLHESNSGMLQHAHDYQLAMQREMAAREARWGSGAAASTSRGATITSGVGDMQHRMGYGLGSASPLHQHSSYGHNAVYYGNGSSSYQNGIQYQFGGPPQQVWDRSGMMDQQEARYSNGMGGGWAQQQWHSEADNYAAQRREPPESSEDEEEDNDVGTEGVTFTDYRPAKLPYGKPHPDPVVETASLGAVEPPDVTYQLQIQDVVESGALSGLQLESIVYACQRHEQFLPDKSRCAFFIGDGAGVGKGRTIAGLVLENWRCGRQRHLWLTIGTDLRIDSRRDLDDVGATDIPLHPLNKLPYGQLDSDKVGVKEGVVLLTYSSLISAADNGASRIQQVVDWCGPDFDGLVVFDECHKAKNLVPDSGSKPTKVGEKVLQLQRMLPNARVVYCSATGASEPRNLGYMERLGLWGVGTPSFATFPDFLEAVGGRGVGALELVAMDMKARGMFVCRTLSFKGCEFEVVEAPLEEPVLSHYRAASRMWNQLRREFLYAAEQAGVGDEKPGRRGNLTWRTFWGAHQRFFRHLCMAAKVPGLVRMSQAALEEGKCVVIGLQSTGEARTLDVVAERAVDGELDDFVSGPKELLLKLVEENYPLAPDPDAPERDSAASTSGRGGSGRGQGGTGRGRGRKRSAPDSEGTDTGKPARRKRATKKELAAMAEKSGRDKRAKTNGGAVEVDLTQDPDDDRGPEVLTISDDDDDDDAAMNGAQQQRTADKGGPGPGSSIANGRLTAHELHQREQLRHRRKAGLARKEQVQRAILGLDLPNNPLDQLIDMLGGPAAVAEMTGRKGRLVRRKTGEAGVKWEARNASGVAAGSSLEMINIHERKMFLDGEKLVAVISEAASAGISLHADRRALNQRQRVHLTHELPWSADKAIQQFGRTHRANQTHGPQYRLVFTPLGGEKRFASAVARRLQSLGALTQGDRRAGTAGPSLSEFNFESQWGQKALKHMYRAICEDEVPMVLPPACQPKPDGGPVMSPQVFYGQARAHLLSVGIIRPAADVTAIDVNAFLSAPHGAPPTAGKVAEVDKGDVPRFLNRLLGLEPEVQECIFDFYQAILEATIAQARREGRYDEGIVDVSGTSITLAEEPQVIRRDEVSRAATLLYKVLVDRGVSWAHACTMLSETVAAAKAASERKQALEAAAGVESAELQAEVNGAEDVKSGATKAEPDKATPEGDSDSDVVCVDEEEGDTAHSGYSGFYRASRETGRSNVLLALQVAGTNPPRFRLTRPVTGRGGKTIDLHELRTKYERLDRLRAGRVWAEAYEAAAQKRSGPGVRVRMLYLISGLVLPVWQEVKRVLAAQPRPAERRLSVIRLETTGEDRKRLVGMLIPEKALPELLAELRSPLEPPEEPEQEAAAEHERLRNMAAKKGSLFDILSSIRK
ncbi:Protein strawberry notch homolog 1 [Coccomyxa sp. Obi]|nr:Protein strawberry notch homolog 1 [Coccomyxa sp. Obi]